MVSLGRPLEGFQIRIVDTTQGLAFIHDDVLERFGAEGLQRAYLAAHPAQAGFHSDLRHAHLDAAELLMDFGPVV